jgi:hypothetical protein
MKNIKLTQLLLILFLFFLFFGDFLNLKKKIVSLIKYFNFERFTDNRKKGT